MNRPSDPGVRPRVLILLAAASVASVGFWFAGHRSSAARSLVPAQQTGVQVDLEANPAPQTVAHPVRVLLDAPVPSAPPRAKQSVLAGGVAIEVVTEQNAPVPGAKFAVVDARAQVVAEGVTDRQGHYLLPRPATPVEIALYVAAAGFADQRLDLPMPLPERARVVLPNAATIRGRVVRAGDGTGAPVGTRVFAWRTLSAPPLGLFRAVDSGLPTMLHANTGPDGTFELTRAEPGVRYTVAAGCCGWTSMQPMADVTADAAAIEVRLWRLFGAMVTARLPNGKEPSPSSLGRWYARGPAGVEAEWVDFPSLPTLLAGLREVSGVWRGNEHDWRRQLVLFAARHDAPTLATCSLRYQIPGFERMNSGLNLPALDRRVGELGVTLRATVAGHGTLKVALRDGVDIKSLGRVLSTTPAHVDLLPDDAAQDPVRVSLRDLGRGVVDVEGVPFGSYRVRVWVGGDRVFPTEGDGEVQIGAQPTEIVVAQLGRGAVLLRVAERDATRHNRSLAVAVRYGGETVRQVSFGQPPYVLQGFVPGEYELEVRSSGRDGDVAFAKLDRVVVKANQLVTEDVRWTR